MTRRLAVLAPTILALTLALSAEAADRDVPIKIQPGSQITFAGIRCVAQSTTYGVLTCVSFTGPYEVAISKSNVIVVRARDGMVLYRTH
jgi:hypothetical protein